MNDTDDVLSGLSDDQDDGDSEGNENEDDQNLEEYDNDDVGHYVSDADEEANNLLGRDDCKIYYDKTSTIPQISLV